MEAPEAILGHGSFGTGNEPDRFEHLVASNSRLGNEFKQAWLALQTEAGSKCVDTMLAQEAKAAGIGKDGKPGVKVQKTLTTICELKTLEEHTARMKEAPDRDRTRIAWFSADLMASHHLTAIPSPGQVIQNREWPETAAVFYGASL